MNIEAERPINITFSELRAFSGNEIQEYITEDEAVEISTKADGNEVGEVFETWMDKLFKVFLPTNISGANFLKLMNYFSKYFPQLKYVQHFQNKDSDSFLNTILNYVKKAITLLEWVSKVSLQVYFTKYVSMLTLVETIAMSALDMINFNGKTSSFLQQAITLHNNVLKVLEKNMSSFIPKEVQDIEILSELILKMCQIGGCKAIDIKTTVETWKYITRLSLKLSEWLSGSRGDFTELVKTVVKQPIKILLAKVVKYAEETSKLPIEQATKHVLIISFYINILLRLTADFTQENNPMCEEYIKMFISITNLIDSINDTRVRTLFEQQVTSKLQEILILVYKNPNLLNVLTAKNFHAECSEIYKLTTVLISTIINKKDGDYLKLNATSLSKLLSQLTRDPSVFVNEQKYNHCIELYAAFLIFASTCEIEIYAELFDELVREVISENFTASKASIDVISIVLRFGDFDEEFQIANFNFWYICCKNFVPFSSAPHSHSTQFMLQNIYIRCQYKSKKTFKENFDKLILEQQKTLFNAIRLDNLFDHEEEFTSVTAKLCEDMLECYEKCLSNHFNVNIYYQMVENLHLLLPISNIFLDDKIFAKVSNLCEIVLKQDNEVKYFSLLIEFLLEFVISHITKFSKFEISTILKLIGKNSKYLQNIYGTVSFLNETFKMPAFKEKSIEISNVLTMEGNEAFQLVLCVNSEKYEENKKIDLKMFKNISGVYQRFHNCYEVASSAKRLKLQNENTCASVKNTLKGMLETSENINKCELELDEENIFLITKIVDNLNRASKVRNHFQVENL